MQLHDIKKKEKATHKQCKQYIHNAFRWSCIRRPRLLLKEYEQKNDKQMQRWSLVQKQKAMSISTLDAWPCLSLNDLLFKCCFNCEFTATEPFETVSCTSASLPSLPFFTWVAEAFFRCEGFAVPLFPGPFWDLAFSELSASFTFTSPSFMIEASSLKSGLVLLIELNTQTGTSPYLKNRQSIASHVCL